MTGFQFVDHLPGGPFQPLRTPNRKPRPETKVLFDFADALRERPMEWAVWPRPLTENTAKATSDRVRDGFYRQLSPGGGYQTSVREGVLYVRFNPDRVTTDLDRAFRDGYAAGHKRGLEDLGGIIERAFQSARAELRAAKEGEQ